MSGVVGARKARTPAERAQEAVDVLSRRLGKLRQQKAIFERQARDLTPEIEAVTKRLEYAKANPDYVPPKAMPAKDEDS